MAFKYEIYKTQRVCMIRFKRKVEGKPIFEFPDLDNRGSFRKYTDGKFDCGPVVPVMQGDDIYIEILRERIDKSAPLFAVSSDETVMVVGNKNQLPANYSMTLRLTGVQGNGDAFSKKARLEIRYGSTTGVVVGELGVWVFTKMNVNLTPHLITIQDAAGNSAASSVDVGAVIGMVKTIWRPYGVTFTDAPVQNHPPLTFANAGTLAWKNEFNTLLNAYWATDTINAYFVKQIDYGIPGVLGVGLSRQTVKDDVHDPNPLVKPGIFLGDQSIDGIVRPTDIHWLANDLAHEVGHFFKLSHVDFRDGNNPRDDSWTRRMLMHPINTRASGRNWRDDVGYGADYRGALVSMKDLTDVNNPTINHITDPEYKTARQTIKNKTDLY